MNNRIAQVITALGIKKIEFAKKIGISSPFVSELCSGAKKASDRTITDICREFNVNETWLRTGEGEMFIPAPTSELEALASRYPNMTHETYVLVEKLVNLPKASQDIITGFMREVVEGFGDVAPGTPAKAPQEMTDAELHRELDRQLAEEKKQVDGQSASGLGSSEKATG